MADRETLKAALELRAADWRTILRGPHVEQARIVLQHLIELPICVIGVVPVPKYVDAPGVLWGGTRAYKWVADAKPEGRSVGIIEYNRVASPTGEPVFWP